MKSIIIKIKDLVMTLELWKCRKILIIKAIIESTIEAWKNYKIIRNKYKVTIQNEKNKFIDNKICNTNSQKDMWSKIKELVLRKLVIFNNIESSDNIQIADNFNKYFNK